MKPPPVHLSRLERRSVRELARALGDCDGHLAARLQPRARWERHMVLAFMSLMALGGASAPPMYEIDDGIGF